LADGILCLMQARQKKNVETDIMGDKIGRIHLGKQDLGELQTRKMKGLKRGRDTDVEDDMEDDEISIMNEDEDEASDATEPKRLRLY